jgi:NodT family efflux transporter outer membrane factor (OMF) lipoprotein
VRTRLLLLALALTTACKVGPDYVPPEVATPDIWQLELEGGLLQGGAELAEWWTVLEDPVLDVLIERADAGNLDLVIAAARIREARASLGIVRGEQLPDVDGTGSAERLRTSEDGPFALSPPGAGNDDTTLYETGLDATWEIDLWGRVRRSVQAAGREYEAAIEDERDVRVVLFSEVARTYVDLRTLQERLEIARSNVVTQEGSLRLTRSRFDVGLVPELHVRQAESNLATTESSIPGLEQAVAAALHRLAVLLGEQPHRLREELGEASPIPAPPEKVVVGIPANLVRQRPDIRAAERRLAAQTARIGVATADLYPRFTLFGSIGWSAEDVDDLIGSSSRVWNIGPSFRWNLFDGGRVRGNIEVQDARTEQLLAVYENTVLLSLEEVENALVAYVKEQQRSDALSRGVVASRRAAELSRDAYDKGLIDFQNVLDADRSVLALEDALAESRGLVVTNLVALYKALGGGWQRLEE